MIKKPFWGIGKPGIAYDFMGGPPAEIKKAAIPESVTLLCPGRLTRSDALAVTVGDAVKAGQKIVPFKTSDAYVISSVSGVISAIQPYTGDFGKTYVSIQIRSDLQNVMDEEFGKAGGAPSIEHARTFLRCIPGDLSSVLFAPPDKPVKTIVIRGMDGDPGVATQQVVVKTRIESLIQGIAVLKGMQPDAEIILVVPEKLKNDVQQAGVPVKTVSNNYPAALPHLIARDILKKTIPSGGAPGDFGIAFIQAEAVTSLGNAYAEKKIPTEKLLTVITKTGARVLIKAVIGAPIRLLLDAIQEKLHDGDRLIVGGPMTGAAVYDVNHPVMPDMDALVIQKHDDLFLVSDAYCINCGDCIRACPAKIQVNMLVRFIEAGKYQDAKDGYDLDACIECGLCSFVCTSRIPIFQYIKLAKYELARVQAAEANNG